MRKGDLIKGIKFNKKKKRVDDVAFKEMAVSLSEAKGSIKAAADELGIAPGRISK